MTSGRGRKPTISTAVATAAVVADLTGKGRSIVATADVADLTGKGRSIIVLPAVAVVHRMMVWLKIKTHDQKKSTQTLWGVACRTSSGDKK